MRFAQGSEQPVISVCLLTYNHEKWIAQAIDSVLMQEFDEPCEFIIADDCSTDKTREIILSYKEKFPIKLIFQQKNKGAAGNWKDLMDAPVGKYVAFFEGDDAWLDPLKLRKQFDVLEANENVALCYSNAKVLDTKNPDSNIYFRPNSKPPQIIKAHQLVEQWYGPTCTFFFRNKIKPIPEWTLKVRAGDHVMASLIGKFGDAYYIDECLGLHIHHYAGLSRVINHIHFIIDDFEPWFNLYDYYGKDPKVWDAVIRKGNYDINRLVRYGHKAEAKTLFWKWPVWKLLRSKTHRSPTLKLAIKLHIPIKRGLKKAV